jgi:hypothetical protein
VQDAEEYESHLRRDTRPECFPAELMEVCNPSEQGLREACEGLTKEGIKGVPRLRNPSNIKDPTGMSQARDTPPADKYHNIKYTRDNEKVAGKDELVMESMGDDPEGDCEGQRDRPECDGVPICEKDL